MCPRTGAPVREVFLHYTKRGTGQSGRAASKGIRSAVVGAFFDCAAMRVGVVLGGLFRMVCRVKPVAVRYVCVVGSLLVVSAGMVFGSFAVMSRGMFVVFSRFSVVFGGIVLVHGRPLSWRNGRAQQLSRLPQGPGGIISEDGR